MNLLTAVAVDVAFGGLLALSVVGGRSERGKIIDWLRSVLPT